MTSFNIMTGFSSKLNSFQLVLLFVDIVFTATLALDPYADNWGVTQINADKRTIYSWTISNFSLNNKKMDEYISSPIFPNDDDDSYKWSLVLYPNGSNTAEYVAVFLFSQSDEEVKAQFSTAIVDGYGKKVNYQSHNVVFANHTGYGSNKMILLNDLEDKNKNILPDDRLTILVEIIVKNNETVSQISGHCSIPSEQSHGVQQIQTLFKNNYFSDIDIHVGTKVFKVHRGILAAHSSWFLEHFKAYPNRTTLDIDKITGKAMEEILRYIYTGTIENLESVAQELLGASNWLGISQLKSVSQQALCKTMTPKNAVEILKLAELYDAEDLKQQASNYIAAHANNVVDTPDFKDLQKSNPHPLFDIFQAVINRNKA